MGIDIKSILREYDEQENIGTEGRRAATMAEKLVEAGISGSSEAGVRKALSERLSENDAKRMEAAAAIENESGLDRNGKKFAYGDFQRYLSESFTNALHVKNAQKVIMISAQENIRKGLAPEMGSALVKTAAKGQTSTVTIPTALLRYAQQEIGGLGGMRVTQNDAITGFLYWYFGKPDDVQFASQESAAKITAIASALDAHAAPSKFGELSYNAANAALDRISALEDKIDMIRSLVAGVTKDSLESKIKIDKAYIATCFNVLNMLAFTPPVMPGQQPQDIDMLAGGLAWELMSSIDDAYDCYKNTNGREIYRAKARRRMGTFTYAPEQTVRGAPQGTEDADPDPGQGGGSGYDYGDGIDDYVGDDYGGYDSISSDWMDDDYQLPYEAMPKAGKSGAELLKSFAVSDGGED